MALVPGEVLGGYRLVEQIHAGGMAAIWKVKALASETPLAMKVPYLAASEEPSAIICFEVEQMILPKLSGPHVPRFIASGDFTEQPYIVTEYIAGPSLKDRLASVMFSTDDIAPIVAQIATALHDIHRQHVIHLDLTPDNILFRRTGEAVLIDFGLSRHAQLPDLMAEEYQLPMGTAKYISPEQVLHIRNDPRSDIFALGVILYQLCTAELPFDDPTSLAGLKRRLYIDPVPPRALNKSCPSWLQEIILRCLEIDPERRYGSAAQLAFDLQNPSQVILTERSMKGSSSRFVAMLKRCLLRTILVAEPAIRKSVARHLDTVPIVMAAVDTSSGKASLSHAIREEVRQILSYRKNARVTCVTVRKTPLVRIDSRVDDSGRNLYVQCLAELKHWARALDLPADRLSFHVLESPDPASALVQYARTNKVEHIVIGARESSTLRRFLGSVSSQVVAQAPCSVTVVRVHGTDTEQSGDSAGYSAHG